MTSYTTEPNKHVFTLPTGDSLTINHVATDQNEKRVTITFTTPPSLAPKEVRVNAFLQAYPYHERVGYSVLEIGFDIPSLTGKERLQALEQLKAFTRSLLDSLRGVYGAHPCMPDYRTYGGTCNNEAQPGWGAYKTGLMRQGGKDPAFKPGTNEYAKDVPNARTISRLLFTQQGSRKSRRRVSMMLVFWGQFIDHDLGLTPEQHDGEKMDIEVEDPSDVMYARHKGNLEFPRSMGMNTGKACCDAGIGESIPREHINAVSGFIDASQVYGCDRDRVTTLRSWKGGEMLTEKRVDGRDMLPRNDISKIKIKLPNAPDSSDEMFVAGDIRVNEQPVLTSLHTLFVREHNRVSDILGRHLKCTGEERLFQYARKIVSAQVQYITYNFFLPGLLGKHGLDNYKSYDASVNPSIANFFSTCAFRFGHSMVSDTLKILEKRGKAHAKDGVPLHEVFFDPSFVNDVGIEPILLGASHQLAEAADTTVVDSLQNELFKKLTGGTDLIARNIQRGRDHGLPGYNDAREMYNLKRKKSFDDITPDKSVSSKLSKVYKSVGDIDPFVGGLAEVPLEDSELGELLTVAVRDQFKRLREGDKFFYQNLEWPEDTADLPEVKEITEGRLTLQSIIVRNSGGRLSMEDFANNVFIGVEE